MKPEGSVPHLQQPATCPYPGPDRSSPWLPTHFSKINFTIILPSTSESSKWSPSFKFPHQNRVCNSSLHRTCYMPCSSYFFFCSITRNMPLCTLCINYLNRAPFIKAKFFWGERRGVYRALVGKPEGRRPLGRLTRRWEDNIKMDLREVGWGGHGLDRSGSG
jgi:hypothetical protein